MKRRLTAILLVLCICIGLVSTVFAAQDTLESSVDMRRLVEHGISMFRTLEAGGRYDSACNIAGTVGLGIMGWINSSALQLLKWCASSEKGGNPEYCKSVLGEALYYEIINAPLAAGQENKDNLMPPWGYWGGRSFSSSELAAVKLLLGSDVGVIAQNGLAEVYIRREAQHGWAAGVRTEAALLYYCSAENHYGEGSVKGFMSDVRAALGKTSSDTINSLDEFHRGAVLANVGTIKYRTKVYDYLTGTLGLDSGPAKAHICPCANFTDVPGEDNWAHAGIDFSVESGLLIGITDTQFSPNGAMTRAMLAMVLYRMSGQPAVSGSSSFSDVAKGCWYEKAVIWAQQNSIVFGTSDTTFSPDEAVTREVLAAMLYRYSQMIGMGYAVSSKTLSGYTDANQVHDYAYDAMIWATRCGILQGNDSKQLLPCEKATRAQVAAILMRFCTQ